MIAIAMLAALGQAVNDLVLLGGFAVIAVIASVMAAGLLIAGARRKWPQAPEHGELDALEAPGDPGHEESGSGG